MASLDQLSEVEICKKMAEYGINIPYTDSTRKIILLSIKKRMEEKKPASSNLNSNRPTDRRSTALFSSGEDSGHDLNENQKSKMLPPSSSQRKTRRQTIGVVSPPTNTSTKSRRSEFAHILPTISVLPPMSEPKKRVGRSSMLAAQRQTPSISTDEYDAGSDSDVPMSKLFGSRDSKTPAVDKTRPDAMASSSRLATVQSAFVMEQNEASETNGDKSVSSLLSYRKHTTSKAKPNETKSRQSDELSSPFLSDFARRLSQQAGRESRTFGSSIPRTSELFKVKKSDIGDDYIAASTSRSPQNGHFFPAQASTRGGIVPRDLSREFKTTEDAPGFWTSSHVKSMVVLLVFFVFFGALAAAYFSVRANEVVNFSSDNQRNVFPICLPPGDVHESPDPCIPPDGLVPAIALVKHVHPELKRRAILAQCGPPRRDGSYVSPMMTERAVAEWLEDHYSDAAPTTQTNLRDLKKLLLANPHWGMAVVPPTTAAAARHAPRGYEQRDLVAGGGLEAVDVALPLSCHARRTAATLAYSVAVIAAGFLAVFAAQRAVSWWLRRRAAARQEVYALVQRAVELVQAHHLGATNNSASPGGTAAAYLAVNHVRDQLIEPRDRYRMAGSWSQAVDFIEANESRVRSEVQQVCGEECPVWRWLPPAPRPPPSPLNASGAATLPGLQTSPPATTTTSISLSGLDSQHPNRVKVWLGQAFVTAPGAQNGAPRSPTNCLKIRHMFDDIEYGDDWPQKVKDALLEKCGEGVNVLYLVVDRKSAEGCVYMKCATNDDAGIAYRALHGWWFDSKLVTVKYIRLERYHERFPEAVNARTPLRPSNDKKLSLSEDMYPSATLEAN